MPWGKKLDSNPAANRLVRMTLMHWRADPDLAGLREPSALNKLSTDESKECLALWKEAEDVVRRAQLTK
jgi:hypothetical protein